MAMGNGEVSGGEEEEEEEGKKEKGGEGADSEICRYLRLPHFHV